MQPLKPHHCLVPDLMKYIAEQPTSLKLNKYLPGKRIPIIKNDILFKDQPDFVVILAWHLYKPIIMPFQTTFSFEDLP